MRIVKSSSALLYNRDNKAVALPLMDAPHHEFSSITEVPLEHFRCMKPLSSENAGEVCFRVQVHGCCQYTSAASASNGHHTGHGHYDRVQHQPMSTASGYHLFTGPIISETNHLQVTARNGRFAPTPT